MSQYMYGFGRLVLPVLAIIVGLLLLKANLGSLETYNVQIWWPIIFVLFGVNKISRTFFGKADSCNSDESKKP